MKKSARPGRERMMVLGVAGLFLVMVGVVFFVQQNQLRQEFRQLAEENLLELTRGQQRQADSSINKVQGRLMGVANLIAQTELTVDGEWLETYLDQVNDGRNVQQSNVALLDTKQLASYAAMADTETEQEFYQTLLSGRMAVSEIQYSRRQGKRSFHVAMPVAKGGEIIGVLWSRMDASQLTKSLHTSNLFERINTLIVNRAGDILYLDTVYPIRSTNNLYTIDANDSLKCLASQELREKIEMVDSEGISFCLREKNTELYLSAVAMEHKDWVVVQLVLSPDVLVRSNSILQSVFLFGAALILLTAVMGIMLELAFVKKREELDLEMQRYGVLSQFTDTVLFEYDCNQDTLEFTSNARHRFDMEEMDVRRNGYWLQNGLVHPEDWAKMLCSLNNISLEDEEKAGYEELRLRIKGGGYAWFGCKYKVIVDGAGRSSRVIGKLVDITDQKIREEQLRNKAQRDVLTGLYNRSGEEVINSLLRKGSCGLLFMMDLDDFKEINDQCGHMMGDQLLAAVGQVLVDVFRTEDIAVRVGGDEFVVFLPGKADETVARQKGAELQRRISQLPRQLGLNRSMSASMGTAFAPRDGDTYPALYAAADRAMYRAKGKGKGGSAFR